MNKEIMNKGIKFLDKFCEVMVAVIEGIAEIQREVAGVPYKGVRFSSFNRPGWDKRVMKKGIRNLKDRGLLVRRKDMFYLTTQGRKWFKPRAHRYFLQSHPKWDKKWRFVLFDIPQDRKRDREKFRYKLRYLGFYQLQKSVLVFPYPCSREVADVARQLGISKYVDLLVAESAGLHEGEVKKHFDL